MSGNRLPMWSARLSAFVVAALCTASAAYWVLRWNPGSTPATTASTPANTATPLAAPLDAQLLALRLGGGKAGPNSQPASPASGFQLIGVVAARDGSGSAVIAMEGKPAKSYRVGSKVTGELVLQSVEARKAVLSPVSGAASPITIELPGRSKTGS